MLFIEIYGRIMFRSEIFLWPKGLELDVRFTIYLMRTTAFSFPALILYFLFCRDINFTSNFDMFTCFKDP